MLTIYIEMIFSTQFVFVVWIFVYIKYLESNSYVRTEIKKVWYSVNLYKK